MKGTIGAACLALAVGVGQTGHAAITSVVDYVPVPALSEPSGMLLLGVGLIGLAALIRRDSSVR